MARVGATFRVDAGLKRNLDVLGSKPRGKDLDVIAGAALGVLQEEVIMRAPRPSLKRTTVIRRVDSPMKNRRVYWLSFKGMGRRIAHLVEFGTHPHSMHKGASRRKNLFQDLPPWHRGTRAEPFMRPAYESQKDRVFQIAGRMFWDLITAGLSK